MNCVLRIVLFSTDVKPADDVKHIGWLMMCSYIVDLKYIVFCHLKKLKLFSFTDSCKESCINVHYRGEKGDQ